MEFFHNKFNLGLFSSELVFFSFLFLDKESLWYFLSYSIRLTHDNIEIVKIRLVNLDSSHLLKVWYFWEKILELGFFYSLLHTILLTKIAIKCRACLIAFSIDPKKWYKLKTWRFCHSYLRWTNKENVFQTILFSLTVIRIDNCSSHQNMKTISLGSDCQNCLAFFECTYVLLIFLFETTVVISDDWQVRQEGCEVLLHLGLIWEQKMRFSEDFEL